MTTLKSWKLKHLPKIHYTVEDGKGEVIAFVECNNRFRNERESLSNAVLIAKAQVYEDQIQQSLFMVQELLVDHGSDMKIQLYNGLMKLQKNMKEVINRKIDISHIDKC